MLSNHLNFFPPLLLLSSIFPSVRVLFQWVGFSHQMARFLELQLQQQSFQWIFRTGVGGLIFWYHIVFPFHIVHGVLQARILEWVAISSFSRPHFVRTLHYNPSILGGPAQQDTASLSYASPVTTTRLWPMMGIESMQIRKKKKLLIWVPGKGSQGKKTFILILGGYLSISRYHIGKQWIWTLKHKLCKGMTFGYNPI